QSVRRCPLREEEEEEEEEEEKEGTVLQRGRGRRADGTARSAAQGDGHSGQELTTLNGRGTSDLLSNPDSPPFPPQPGPARALIAPTQPPPVLRDPHRDVTSTAASAFHQQDKWEPSGQQEAVYYM
ncbi:hypothetical protein GOODEAATRI_019854, partial [Goodea atripinnis]